MFYSKNKYEISFFDKKNLRHSYNMILSQTWKNIKREKEKDKERR